MQDFNNFNNPNSFIRPNYYYENFLRNNNNYNYNHSNKYKSITPKKNVYERKIENETFINPKTIPTSQSNHFQKPKNLKYYNPHNDFQIHAQSNVNSKTLQSFNTNKTSKYIGNNEFQCPYCYNKTDYFNLQSNKMTLYCSTCRQPFYFCPHHKKLIKGICFENYNKCICNKNDF